MAKFLSILRTNYLLSFFFLLRLISILQRYGRKLDVFALKSFFKLAHQSVHSLVTFIANHQFNHSPETHSLVGKTRRKGTQIHILYITKTYKGLIWGLRKGKYAAVSGKMFREWKRRGDIEQISKPPIVCGLHSVSQFQGFLFYFMLKLVKYNEWLLLLLLRVLFNPWCFPSSAEECLPSKPPLHLPVQLMERKQWPRIWPQGKRKRAVTNMRPPICLCTP